MSALGGGGAKGIKVAGDCIGMGPWEEAQDPHISPPGCPVHQAGTSRAARLQLGSSFTTSFIQEQKTLNLQRKIGKTNSIYTVKYLKQFLTFVFVSAEARSVFLLICSSPPIPCEAQCEHTLD